MAVDASSSATTNRSEKCSITATRRTSRRPRASASLRRGHGCRPSSSQTPPRSSRKRTQAQRYRERAPHPPRQFPPVSSATYAEKRRSLRHPHADTVAAREWPRASMVLLKNERETLRSARRAHHRLSPAVYDPKAVLARGRRVAPKSRRLLAGSKARSRPDALLHRGRGD